MFLEQSVGIDFRENVLRLVILGKGLRGISLIDHILKKYPFSIDKKTPQEKLDELVNDIREFALRHPKAEHIVLGLPRQKVTLRQIVLPTIAKEQLEDMIGYEVKRHIPISEEEVYFDYKIFPFSDQNKQNILLGIVRVNDLDFYLNLLDRANLVPTLATLSSFGLSNKTIGINPASKDDVELYIDLGEGLIECLAMQGDSFLFAKSLDMHEGYLVDDFSLSQKKKIDSSERASEPLEMKKDKLLSALGIDLEEENSSDDFSMSLENKKIEQKQGISPGVQKLASELLDSLSHSFNAANLGEDINIKKISLSGLGIYNIHLSDYFKDKTEVSLPNPFNQLTESQIPGHTASAFAVAVGLARRGFNDRLSDLNLLPQGFRIKRSSSSLKFFIILMPIFLILGIGFAYIGNPIIFPEKVELTRVFEQYQLPNYCFYLPKKLKLLEIKGIRDQLKPKVREVKDIDREIDQVGDEVSKVHDLMAARSRKIEILRELTGIIPESAWLDRAVITNQRIEISGHADSAAGLIGLIEQSTFFENAKFPTTISTKIGSDKEIFRIDAEIEAQKETK